MLHDLHEDDHRGEAISGRISTSRVEHHEPLLAIPEVTNRCVIASGQSLQRCIAHLDQLIRVETVKIFEQSSKSFFSSHQAHRPWKSLPAWMSSWPCRGCAVDQPFSGLSRTTSLEQNCRRQHVQNSAMQTVNVSQHEVMMSESKARTIRFCCLSCTLMHGLSADSCSLCDASHSGVARSRSLCDASHSESRAARGAFCHATQSSSCIRIASSSAGLIVVQVLENRPFGYLASFQQRFSIWMWLVAVQGLPANPGFLIIRMQQSRVFIHAQNIVCESPQGDKPTQWVSHPHPICWPDTWQ